MADVNADGKLPYRKDGYVNKDGFYTVPDPKENESAFQESRTADDKPIWLPVPNMRPCRAINFSEPFGNIHVIESMDRIRHMIDTASKPDAPGWYQFIDPTYGTVIAVPRETLRHVAWVIESFIDIEAVRDNIAQVEYQRRQMRLQLGKRH